MSITRGSLPTDRFTIVSNDWLRDSALSWKAKGLLAYIASHAPGHALTSDQIVAEGTDGRDAVRAGLVELEQRGYLKRVKLRGEGGKIAGTNYELGEPTQMTVNGKPSAGQPGASADQQERAESAARNHSGLSGAGKPAGKKNSSLEDQEKTTSGTAADAPAVNLLLGEWIDYLKSKGIEQVPGQWRARYGKEIKHALGDGFHVDHIKRALALLLDKGKVGQPNLLPHMLIEVQAGVAPVSGGPAQPTFRERDEANARAKKARRAQVLDLAQKLIDAGMDSMKALKQAEAEVESRAGAHMSVETNAGVPYIDGDLISGNAPKEVTGS